MADRPFAYLTPDLGSLVVRVADDDWEVLRGVVDGPIRPRPPATPRQRGHFATVDLSTVSEADVTEALVDAWLACAPRRLVDEWQATAANHLDA